MESLVRYVDVRQELNEKIKPKFPKIDADKLRKDPKSYALDVIEASFIKHIPFFIKAYKAGQTFGNEVKENAKIEDKKDV